MTPLRGMLLALVPLFAPLESRLVFPGAYGVAGAWTLPAAVATGFTGDAGASGSLAPRLVTLESADGLALRAALLRAPGGASDAAGGAADAPWLIYLHGQGGSVPDYLPLAAGLAARGLNLLLVEYRGYGGNPGRPSETGLQRDAEAALAWLASRGVPPERIALYGFSLGSGVAVAVAAARAPADQPAALVLEAPYTSVAAIARERFGVPERVVRNRFDTLTRAARVVAPTLVLHARNDRVIPPRHGREVVAALGGTVRLLELDGGHAGMVTSPDPTVLDAVAKFVGATRARQ